MFISTVMATASFGLIVQQAPVVFCPVTLEPVVTGMKVTEYNGARFTYCCAGCDSQFEKDPQTYLDKAAKQGKTVGVFLFDPISKNRLESKNAKGGFSDYKGLRFYFESESDKATFANEPAKYGTLPKMEALYCPVSKEKVSSYGKASGYGDFKGTRYYFCCAGCDAPFGKDPAKYVPDAASYVKVPAPVRAESDLLKQKGGN